MTTLIIGGSGLLGTELTRQAAAAGHTTVATYATEPGDTAQAKWHSLDLHETRQLDEVMAEVRPSLVINVSSSKAAWTVTAQGPIRIAMSAAKLGSRLVHVSSDAVFSGAQVHYDESCLPDPLTPYGAAKAAAEAWRHSSTCWSVRRFRSARLRSLASASFAAAVLAAEVASASSVSAAAVCSSRVGSSAASSARYPGVTVRGSDRRGPCSAARRRRLRSTWPSRARIARAAIPVLPRVVTLWARPRPRPSVSGRRGSAKGARGEARSAAAAASGVSSRPLVIRNQSTASSSSMSYGMPVFSTRALTGSRKLGSGLRACANAFRSSGGQSANTSRKASPNLASWGSQCAPPRTLTTSFAFRRHAILTRAMA
ncbi:sugar nucleotide-binding protein [Streptomyces sp. NPDC102264]|uniref:sugar nucleotide-binding protein n=1 Tax=Streptomyces sp. NPDC102264 TaxID=3366149 RepID=UPI00381C1986